MSVSCAAGEDDGEGVAVIGGIAVMVTRIGVAVNVTVGVTVSVGSVTTGGSAHARLNTTTARARAMMTARAIRLRITCH